MPFKKKTRKTLRKSAYIRMAQTVPGKGLTKSRRVRRPRVAPGLHGVLQYTAQDSTNRTSLLSLPPELLCMVTNHLRKSSNSLGPLVSLARTCKRLSQAIHPILFRSLRSPLSFPRRRGLEGEYWSMRGVYNLLRSLEENPRLRDHAQSIVFTGNEVGDILEVGNWDASNNAQNERLFNKLVDRYVEKPWRLEGESRAIREYPLQLTLLLCLVRKTLHRAHIRVPVHFWTRNGIKEWGNGVIIDNYNANNIPVGVILKEIPIFDRLTDLTLEGDDGFTNTKAIGMMLPAMPNLAKLTFRNCSTVDIDSHGQIRIPEHVSSLTLDRCPKLRRQYTTVPNHIILHDRLRSFFSDDKSSDLRGVYARDSGFQKAARPKRSGLVEVRPDQNISAPQLSSHHPYRFQQRVSYGRGDSLAKVLEFLSPAASSLERIYLGDCGRVLIRTATPFGKFSNLKTVSIHCSNFHSNVGNAILVHMFKGCQSLEVIELVGVDREYVFSRLFLDFAKAIKLKEDGCFPELKRVNLICHKPRDAMPLVVDPFASMFAEGKVELVLMAREI